MPIHTEMKDPYLRKLKCAYTGKPVKVMMSGTKSASQLYFVDGAADPADWYPTSRELFKILGSRDGVENAARDGAELFCPYTNVRMSIERHPKFGFRALNGYRPTVPVRDPFLLAAKMMTRKGVTPKEAPKPAVVTAEKIEDKTPDSVHTPIASEDEALQAAEDILKDGMPTKTMVQVAKIEGE